MTRSPYRWDVQSGLPIVYPPTTPSSTAPNPDREVGAGAWLVAYVQLEWFKKFTSVIEIGADILYRDNPAIAAETKEAWYAMTEYPRQALCDDFLPCLLTEGGLDTLIQALQTQIVSSALATIVEGKFPQLTQGLGEGTPPSDEILTAPLGLDSNPSCNLDILWAQCLAVVTTLTTALLDLMENIEVATNIVELGNALVSSVPVLSALAETVGANGWADLANYFQEAFQEGFVAGYTETPGGTRDQLACQLFCLCQDDCTITIDRIFSAVTIMFGGSIPDTALASLQAAAEYISGISLFSAESSYFATMFVAVLMAKAGSAFFPAITQGTLNLVLALAADEPSNDWQLLCDCTPPPTLVSTFSWGIKRWRLQGGDWVDVTYTQTNAQGIPCGDIELAIDRVIELERIATGTPMGIGWRTGVWPNPPRAQVKVSGWTSASPYYFTTAFVPSTPPNNTALQEAGDLGSGGTTLTFLGVV